MTNLAYTSRPRHVRRTAAAAALVVAPVLSLALAPSLPPRPGRSTSKAATTATRTPSGKG